MEKHGRLVVASTLALALVLRLAFVLQLPALPLYWDEPHYAFWGDLYARAWASVRTPSLFLPLLRAAFEKSLQKGEAYSALVGLLYTLAGAQPKAVFIVQAVLDTCSCACVYGIARQLGGRAVGVVALMLAAMYEPFVFAAARLQTETMCTCVSLAGLWAFVARSHPRQLAGKTAAGCLLALAMLIRPALQFLFAVLLPLVWATHSDAPRWRRAALAAAFAAGFFLLIGPRLALTHYFFGHAVWSGTTDPSVNVYAGAALDNLGWRTDRNSFAIPPRGEMLAVLQAWGAAQPGAEDYWRATLLTWRHHPLQSMAVALHKLYQAWSHPYNDSRRRWLTGLHGQRVWHKAMLVLAAIGMPLALRNRRIGLPLVVTAFYLWSTYLAVQIEVRYAIVVLPVMLCFAALALVTLGRGLRAAWQAGCSRSMLIPAVTTLVLSVLLRCYPLGRLLELCAALSPRFAENLRAGVMLLVMVLSAALVFQPVRRAVGCGWGSAAALLPLVLGMSIFLVGRPLANVWHRWKAPLTAGRGVVHHDFLLPADVQPPQDAELRLDLSGSSDPGNDLVVTVNGTEARRFVGGPSRDDAVPPESFYVQLFEGQGRQARPWHGWYAVPLASDSLLPSATLQVELRIVGNLATDTVAAVFGDYPSGEQRIYDGPSPFAPGLTADTSVYKYLGDGDLRMRRRVSLSGTSRSSFSDGRGWMSADLSSDPGRQFGRYRIFLVLTYADGHKVVF